MGRPGTGGSFGKNLYRLDRQPLGSGLPSAESRLAGTPLVMVSLPDVLSRFSRQTKELFSIVYTSQPKCNLHTGKIFTGGAKPSEADGEDGQDHAEPSPSSSADADDNGVLSCYSSLDNSMTVRSSPRGHHSFETEAQTTTLSLPQCCS